MTLKRVGLSTVIMSEPLLARPLSEFIKKVSLNSLITMTKTNFGMGYTPLFKRSHPADSVHRKAAVASAKIQIADVT